VAIKLLLEAIVAYTVCLRLVLGFVQVADGAQAVGR
jgi:hypothetical protein